MPVYYKMSNTASLLFSFPGFIETHLHNIANDCIEISKAIAHYSYDNFEFSKKICKILLRGINKSDYDKVKNYLEVVTQLSMIHDEF